MIVEDGKYYLYRHIRLDKNEPFYIGVGTTYNCNNLRSKYHRANTTHKRNKIWNRIVDKSDYIVEILVHSDNRDFIFKKEVEFIKLYGRILDNTGTLANIELGGNIRKEVTHNTKKVFCLNDKKSFNSFADAAKYYSINRTSVSGVIRGINSHANGLVFSRNMNSKPKIKKVKLKTGEKFVEIPYFENYKVSNLGRVIRVVEDIKDVFGNTLIYHEKELKPVKKSDGSMQVSLCKGDKTFPKILSKLVWEVFKKTNNRIRHINGKKEDCRLENLDVYFRKESISKHLGIRVLGREKRFLATGKDSNGLYKIKLGTFKTEEEALEAQRIYHEGL